MTANRYLLVNYCQFSEPEPVAVGDGRFVNAYGYGQVDFTMIVRNKVKYQQKSNLPKVLYVPKLAKNLFSARSAASKGKVVQFGLTLCRIKNSNMYRLNCKVDKPGNQASVANETATKLNPWYQRMAHLNYGQMKTMPSKELNTGSDIPGTGKLSFCDPCPEGKAQRAPFKPVSLYPVNKKVRVAHSDFAGPMKNESFVSAKYFATFIDDYFRCVIVYPIKHKSGKNQGVGGSSQNPSRI